MDDLQFRLETSPIDAILELLLIFNLIPMCGPRGMESLAASHGLHKHSPRLYWSQDRHEVDPGKEEALRLEDTGLR